MANQTATLALLGLITLPIGAIAQSATGQLSAQLRQCQTIDQDQARLKCYDQLASSTAIKKHGNRPSNSNAKKTVQPQPTATVSPQSAFGMEQKLIAEQAPEQLKAKVVKVVKNPYGQLKFTLDNGQVWKQSSSHRLRLKVDETIIINRGIMGSFRLQKENSNRNFDVKRVK